MNNIEALLRQAMELLDQLEQDEIHNKIYECIDSALTQYDSVKTEMDILEDNYNDMREYNLKTRGY